METGVVTASKPVHERIYQELRMKLLFGEIRPGKPVTLQGVADELNVSLTPVREAVRRLTAERALQLHGNRRVSVPGINKCRIDEILIARTFLEPELARRALPHIKTAVIDQLVAIDLKMDRALEDGDVIAYLKCNYDFHFGLYRHSGSVVLLPIVESLWIQVAPYLRVACGRFGTSNLVDQHHAAIDALRAGDADALHMAIMEDIRQGTAFIRETMQSDKSLT